MSQIPLTPVGVPFVRFVTFVVDGSWRAKKRDCCRNRCTADLPNALTANDRRSADSRGSVATRRRSLRSSSRVVIRTARRRFARGPSALAGRPPKIEFRAGPAKPLRRRAAVSGRGPTALMSPRRMLTNCGISSRPVARSTRPTLVTRPSRIDRNFKIETVVAGSRAAPGGTAPAGHLNRDRHRDGAITGAKTSQTSQCARNVEHTLADLTSDYFTLQSYARCQPRGPGPTMAGRCASSSSCPPSPRRPARTGGPSSTRFFPPLGLATLAAYLPPDDEAVIEDEHVAPLHFDDRPDLVAIQVYITNARRAYRLADHYRARGAFVVLGGLHVTSLPDEAAAHADAIFLGPGEQTFPGFLRTFERDVPRRRYVSTSGRTLDRAAAHPPRPDRAAQLPRPELDRRHAWLSAALRLLLQGRVLRRRPILLHAAGGRRAG